VARCNTYVPLSNGRPSEAPPCFRRLAVGEAPRRQTDIDAVLANNHVQASILVLAGPCVTMLLADASAIPGSLTVNARDRTVY